MVADLRKMQENQGVSENRIDKSGFVVLFNSILSADWIKYKNSRASGCACLLFYEQHTLPARGAIFGKGERKKTPHGRDVFSMVGV